MSSIHEILDHYVIHEGPKLVIDFKRSEDSYFCDAVTGKKYLDLSSMFASQPLGYRHAKVLEKSKRLFDSALCKVTNSDIYSEPYADFVRTLFDNIPSCFKHSFFIEGGGPAVGNALKVAFDWKAKKCEISDWAANNMVILHLRQAFHGRTGYTLSLTNTTPDKTDLFPRFNWPRISAPAIEFPEDDKIEGKERCSIAQAKRHLEVGNVAGIIVEPIQGEGGDRHFRKEYFQELRNLADEYEALLIFDEIQTGMGLTGKMWCHEHFDVYPDIMCFGKKAQVCGIVATNRVDEVDNNVFVQPYRINSTWGGNLTDMVRSTIYMEIIREENLVDNAAEVGEYFLNKLRELESPKIANLRGRGLMIAFDCENRDEVLAKLNEKAVVLGCGERSIRFRPHLTFSKNDADVAVDMVKNAI